MIVAQLRARKAGAPGYGVPHELHVRAHGGRPLWALNRWRSPFVGRFPGARPGAGLEHGSAGAALSRRARSRSKIAAAHSPVGREQERTPAMNDAESVRLLKFFTDVVAHQVGNHLTPLGCLGLDGECGALIGNIFDSYNRITSLCSLAVSQLEGVGALKMSIEKLRFTEEEQAGLELRGESAGWFVSIPRVRELLKREAEKFGASLSELQVEKGKLPQDKPLQQLDKILPNLAMFGIPLSHCVAEVAGGTWAWDSKSGPVGLGSIFGQTLRTDPLVEISGLDGACGNRVRVNVVFARAIVSNVISNAKRAMEGMPDSEPIEVNIWTEREFAVVHFRDHGCGMGSGKMERINRGEAVKSTKTEAGTHGIGLKCCGEMAREMGGSLKVISSRIGEGTLIELKMKLAGREVEGITGCS